MTEFVEHEEITAKETGDLRHLSVLGECPFRTLWGDLVIVRGQLFSLQTFLSQSLGPMPTLSTAPAAPRTGIRGYRWLHKYPHRPTTVFHSVLEPKKMKQRKKNIFFNSIQAIHPQVHLIPERNCRFFKVKVLRDSSATRIREEYLNPRVTCPLKQTAWKALPNRQHMEAI